MPINFDYVDNLRGLVNREHSDLELDIFALKILFDTFGTQTELIQAFLQKWKVHTPFETNIASAIRNCKENNWLTGTIENIKHCLDDPQKEFLHIMHEIHHLHEQEETTHQEASQTAGMTVDHIWLVSDWQIESDIKWQSGWSLYATAEKLEESGWVRYCELKGWPNHIDRFNGTRVGWLLLVKLSKLTKTV